MNLRKILAVVLLSTVIFSCNRVGDKVSDRGIKDVSGSEIRFEGRISVVNVWATWCGTCISEIPALNKLAEKYSGNPDVQFIAISDEDLNTVESSLARFPFHFRHVSNGSELTRELKSRLVKTYPQNLIIDQNGVIVYEHSDASNDIFKTLDEKLTQLIQNQAE